MKAQVFKDPDGFWVARIEEVPASGGVGGVWRRHTLPVPPSATLVQAVEAFDRLIDAERGRRGLR